MDRTKKSLLVVRRDGACGSCSARLAFPGWRPRDRRLCQGFPGCRLIATTRARAACAVRVLVTSCRCDNSVLRRARRTPRTHELSCQAAYTRTRTHGMAWHRRRRLYVSRTAASTSFYVALCLHSCSRTRVLWLATVLCMLRRLVLRDFALRRIRISAIDQSPAGSDARRNEANRPSPIDISLMSTRPPKTSPALHQVSAAVQSQAVPR